MPIDFRKLIEAEHNKSGKCLLPIESYDTISGYRIDCVTLQRTDVQVHYIIQGDHNKDGLIFKIPNGVTGFESWYVKTLLENPNPDYWAANCLSENRYDGLYVDGKEVLEKLNLFK